MGRYLIKRIFFLVFTLWGILTVVFFLSRIMPGDPAIVVAGPKASAEQIENIRRLYGFDKPVLDQYLIYVKNLVLRGDLGISIYTQRPVNQEIIERFPVTLELTLVALAFAAVVGIAVGIAAATRYNGWLDYLIRGLTVGGISLPGFWLAILLQLLFFSYLEILPAQGRIGGEAPFHITGLYLIDSLLEGNLTKFGSSLVHLILPAFTLSLGFLAQIARITRSTMLEVIHELYILKARSIGLGERRVLYGHALRNAFLPILTAIGMYAGLALGGSVIIESVFFLPGIGYFMYKAVINADFNAIMGVTLVFATVYLLLNMLVDLTYPLINPQIKLD